MARPNNDSLKDLVKRYRGLIRSIASRTVRNPLDLEEVEQEILVKLWNSMERYDPTRAKESTFIAMLARRCVIDFLRARGRRPFEEPIESAENVGAWDADNAIGKEDAVRLVEAMNMLPPERAQLLDTSFWSGLSHREIAKKTGISLGTVKSHLRRGINELRSHLDAVGQPAAA